MRRGTGLAGRALSTRPAFEGELFHVPLPPAALLLLFIGISHSIALLDVDHLEKFVNRNCKTSAQQVTAVHQG